MKWLRRMRLQTRLFLWFIVAVIAGAFASAGVVALTDRDSDHPMHLFARTVATQAEQRWDDPAALAEYVRSVHDATGLDLVVVRDPSRVDDVTWHRDRVVGFSHGQAVIPVSKRGAVVGVVTYKSDLPRTRIVRPLAGIVVSLLVLAIGARRLSLGIASPLERVADAADKLGGGDLTARARVGDRGGTEVSRVGAAFDAMASRVESLVRDQRELLGAVSHELRSPLGRARVALEIAREQDDKQRALGKLGDQLDSLESILGDLLDVTRVGLTDLQHERIELVPWLESLVAPEDASIVREATPVVSGDRKLLERVLDNLVSNAKVHGQPEGVPVEIDVAVRGDRARVTVRDSGGGFPPDLLHRAFEAFVRGDAARSPDKGAGAGLGLALVERIVTAHGGEVGARNVESGGKVTGAEVWFELPLAQEQRVA